ncbi:unnamed protein product [Haemonchus placei]|uniref:Eph LBD domain-containing protein n=1 Tax=Haemonchus placei TaxID=6290 RepID=A0A0N4X8W1_HAEPC|nr:unnamed protein product [Haemonchus placei]
MEWSVIDVYAAETAGNPHVSLSPFDATIFAKRYTPDYDMLLMIYDEWTFRRGRSSYELGSQVYYVVCDATVTKFTKYPVTVTSSSRDDMVKVTGKCVANAIPAQSEAPTGFCTSTGRWNHLIGECGCKPGYTSDSFNGEDKCVVGTLAAAYQYQCSMEQVKVILARLGHRNGLIIQRSPRGYTTGLCLGALMEAAVVATEKESSARTATYGDHHKATAN